MIHRSVIEEVVNDLKNARQEAAIKKHDYQAIGLRKAIDKLQNVLLELEEQEDGQENTAPST